MKFESVTLIFAIIKKLGQLLLLVSYLSQFSLQGTDKSRDRISHYLVL
jgi:hypothetical protein